MAIALTIPTVAHSAELTAGDVYKFCSSRDEVALTACRFFVLGAVLGIEFGDSAVRSGPRLSARTKSQICMPEGVTQSEMVSIYQGALAQLKATHPEDLLSPAVPLVSAALGRAFPCSKSK